MSLNPPYFNELHVEVGKERSEALDNRPPIASRPSKAKLSLQRCMEQTLPGAAQKKDGVKPGDPAAAGVSAKGKPRLLLMGQRR